MRHVQRLLSFWRRPAYWRDDPDQDSAWGNPNVAELTDQEKTAWVQFVLHSHAWPPRTHTGGLRLAVAARNITQTGSRLTVAQLVGRGLAFTVGPRSTVALFGQPKEIPWLYTWTLALPPRTAGALHRATLDAAIEKKFRAVKTFGGWVIAAEPKYRNRAEDTHILVGLAQAAETDRHLFNVLRKALALELEQNLLDGLAVTTRDRIATTIEGCLLDAAGHLGWATDMQLSNAHDGVRGQVWQPAGSSTRLLDIYDLQYDHRHYRTPICTDFYVDLARVYAHAASPWSIANLATKLPLGATLLCLLKTVSQYRPSVLGRMVWHPSWRTEGLFAATEMISAEVNHGPNCRIQMEREWRQLQGFLRRQQFDPPHSDDVGRGLALWHRDEQLDLNFASNPAHSRPRPSLGSRLDPWRVKLSDAAFATAVVEHVEVHIGSTDAFDHPWAITELRLLQLLRETGHPDLAERVARHFVHEYAQAIDPLNSAHFGALDMGAFGELLAGLVVLKAQCVSDWAKWLSPFDLAAALNMAESDDAKSWRGARASPTFNVTQSITRHFRNLVAHAAYADEGPEREIVEAAASLFLEERTRDLAVRTFEFQPLLGFAGYGYEPLIRLLGQALSRTPDVGGKVVRRVRRENPRAIELAHLVWGMGLKHPVVEATSLLQDLRDLAEPANSQSLGLHGAVDQAVALHQCGLLDEAAEYADAALKMLDGMLRTSRSPHRFLASQVQWSVWATRRELDKLEGVDANALDRDLRPILFNYQAVARLEGGDGAGARRLIETVLKQAPKNRMALANLVASYAAEKNWDEVIAAARRVEEALRTSADENGRTEVPVEVYEAEALAWWSKGDLDQAATVLRSLPRSALTRPWLVALRTNLMVSASPVTSQLEDDIRSLRKQDPALAERLRQKLEPLSQLERNFRSSFTDATVKRLSFEERCARKGEEPLSLLVKSIANGCRKLSGHPDLMGALNEDQLTLLLSWQLTGLVRYGVQAQLGERGGHGEKREGVADLTLMSIDEEDVLSQRPVLKGEAKIWGQKSWVEKAPGQVFGVANTRAELAVCVIYYVKTGDFVARVNEACKLVEDFVAGEPRGEFFQCVGPVEDVSVEYVDGDTVKVLASAHRVSSSTPDAYPDVKAFTFVVDLVSEAAKAARRVKAKAKKHTTKKRTSKRSGTQ